MRTRQPQEIVRAVAVNGRLPLAWIAANKSWIFGNVDALISNKYTSSVAQGGKSIFVDSGRANAAAEVSGAAANILNGATSFTVVIVATPTVLPTGSTEERLLDRWESSSQFMCEWRGPNFGVAVAGSSVEARINNTACTAGQLSTNVVTWNAGRTGNDRHRFWLNGAQGSSVPWFSNGDSSGLPTVSSNIGIGAANNGYGVPLSGTHIHGFFVYPTDIGNALARDASINPWGALLAAPRRIWSMFAPSAGVTNHSLTASNLTGGTPTLGSPALAQDHVLTASALTSGTPTLGAPAVSQAHVLTATALTGSAPTLGSPAVTQGHVLAATALAGAAALLGQPAVTQIHVLSASNLTGSAPTLGTPALTQNHALTASALVGAYPILGSPAFGQNHLLTATGIIGALPVLGAPTLTEGTAGNDDLLADNLTGSAPILGSPLLRIETPGVHGSRQYALRDSGEFRPAQRNTTRPRAR